MERWTRERVHEQVRTGLRGTPLVVVSNREPYVHEIEDGQVVCLRPASGLVTALDPVMRACGGIWVAHGSGTADRKAVDAEGKIAVPPEDPSYTVKRLWLTEEEEQGYYYGFANETLWPLCHIAYVRPAFREGDWVQYCRVNHLFADAVCEEITGPTCVWIHDYHFALLPRFLKERRADLTTGHFWHIPWPNPEVFRTCPWKRDLLEGLLANDLLGFNIRHHCDNFLDTVDRELNAAADRERSTVSYRNHTTLVQPFPISVDFEGLSETANSPAVHTEMKRLQDRYGLLEKRIVLGLDRIDYTKGILERLRAIDRFLETCPQYKKRFVFVQAGVPSRRRIPAYQALNEELTLLVAMINRRHGMRGWQPIILARGHHDPVQVQAWHRLADVCLVTSLHDGMNLVAKEYVASRVDGDGVLLLSEFTGTASELADAILVNPYDTARTATRLGEALEMSQSERRARMARLRRTVAGQNIYGWAVEVLGALMKLRRGEPTICEALIHSQGLLRRAG